jgi:hypothetical protein
MAYDNQFKCYIIKICNINKIKGKIEKVYIFENCMFSQNIEH